MREAASSSVFVRVWLLGAFHIELQANDGTWETLEKSVWDNSYARLLLKRLLSLRGRRASRSDLIDDLWPERPAHLAEKYLNNAASKLDQLFRHKKLLTSYGPHGAGGYMLVDQSCLWTDIDECAAHLITTERIGRTSLEALLLLERAAKNFDRGGALEGETGQWCLAIRSEQETTQRCCLIWLAEAYETHQMLWQARSQHRKLLEINPIDEDVLCRLLVMLHKHGTAQEVRACYEEGHRRFRANGLSLSSVTTTLVKKLLQEPRSPDLYLATRSPQPSLSLPYEQQIISPSLPSATQDIILARTVNGSEGNAMDQHRRTFLQQAMYAAQASVVFPDSATADMLDRLSRALTEPTIPDETALRYLDQRATYYWRDRHEVALPPRDLLIHVAQQLRDLTILLEGSLLPSTRTRLCDIAGKTALLYGVLLYDLGEHEQARNLSSLAIKAAREAESASLQAICWGWRSFTWISTREYQPASACIQQACKIASQSSGILVQAWINAIEAELQAHLQNRSGCLDALAHSEKAVLAPVEEENYMLFRFDLAQLWGYKGTCLQQLYHQQNSTTHGFLREAQAALEQALASDAPKRRKITYLSDLAGTYARQGEVEQACSCATQCLTLIDQFGAKHTQERLLQVLRLLHPYKDTSSVQLLNEQTDAFLSAKRWEGDLS